MGLYLAIHWVRELNYKDVIFELDAKCVVDAFKSKRPSIAEFRSLISVCKELFTFLNHNSHTEFARRNANKVVHSLARVTLLSASPHDYFDVPSCVASLILMNSTKCFL